jgi:hypothetical protein
MNRLLKSLVSAAFIALPLSVTAAPPAMNAEAIIQNALSATPENLAAHATVKNWEDHSLREGTNGWVG